MTENGISRWLGRRNRGVFRYVILRGLIIGIICSVLLCFLSKSYRFGFISVIYFFFEQLIKYSTIWILIFLISWIINENRYIRYHRKIGSSYKIEFKDKRKILLMVVILIIIGLTRINNHINLNKEFDSAMKVHEVKEAIESNLSEINYKNYVNVEMYESELMFNMTTPEQIQDDEFSNIKYVVRVENISDKTIKLIYKFYIPEELTKTIIFSDLSFGGNIELKSGEGYGHSIGVIMKHYDTLTNEEKELFDKLKDTLYVGLDINGEKAYTKVTEDVNKIY